MGDPVTMAIGATAIAGSTYLGGRQQRNALKMEATQLQTQQKAIETNAAISQAERLRKLKTTLAAQNAMYAMTGQTAGVGSAGAIQAASMSEANKEQRIENLQTDIAKSALDYNIWSAKKASHLAMGTQIVKTTLDLGGMMAKSYFAGKMGGKNADTEI